FICLPAVCPAPVINWSRGASSHGPDVHSKFRPVKRVSPLKHHPETDSGEPKDATGPAPGPKDDPIPEKAPAAASANVTVPAPKHRPPGAPHSLFGELEHYDLDMDEILDVPYIKSSPMSTTLPRTAAGTLERNQRGFCVLSPVKWSDLRKSRSVDPDLHHLQRPGAAAGKLLSARVFPDVQRASGEAGGSSLMFAQAGGTAARPDTSKPWAPAPEMDEETKRNNNILNIVREGQVSLLPHLAADNLEQIRDEQNNNLLHVSASQGHSQCLQHLTSLMGEDGLNERNMEELTPAGLAVKNGHLECVRWMVSETEAIAELSCTREFPSLIHYAAQHGQEKVLLWLLQFMQEQAISLDEADPNGNTAVHTAAQHGHLTCIQTLVEYGSNVTVLNQQGERASQSAERHGHTSCARYLVVVETCMSLASQVVKLTKQLNDSHHAPVEAWSELLLTAEANPGDGGWTVRQLQGREDQNRQRPSPLAPAAPPEDQAVPDHLQLMLQKHLPHSQSIPHSISSADQRKSAFSLRESKSVDHSLGDAPAEPRPPETTSPKSALKSPSSRRKTSQNLKLRVTFDEQMIHRSQQEPAEPGKAPHAKRSFGSFRSIMETLSGNSNHSNNNSSNSSSATAANHNSPARKGGGPGGGAKGKSRNSNV
uniref:Synuclein, alpha interacting protein n=1 Tax=Neogobius melanostomus TaxID=47308 RepID=A0A8C6WHK9_9GOBI